MKKEEIKLLRISNDTWNKLSKYAKYGDTHNDIVLRILDKLKTKQ